MGAMPVGCYKQMSPIKEGVIMRLQCSSSSSSSQSESIQSYSNPLPPASETFAFGVAQTPSLSDP